MATFRAKDCSNPLTNRSIDLLFPVSTNHERPLTPLVDDSDAGLAGIGKERGGLVED